MIEKLGVKVVSEYSEDTTHVETKDHPKLSVKVLCGLDAALPVVSEKCIKKSISKGMTNENENHNVLY